MAAFGSRFDPFRHRIDGTTSICAELPLTTSTGHRCLTFSASTGKVVVYPAAAFGLTDDDQPSRHPRSKLAVHAGNPPRPLNVVAPGVIDTPAVAWIPSDPGQAGANGTDDV